MRSKGGKAIRARDDNHECDASSGQILLIAEIRVESHQDIKLGFCQVQKLAVFFAGPARFLNRPTIVAMFHQTKFQRSGCAPRPSSRNWSRVSPPSK